MADVTLDNMEYSSNAAAQAEYVTNDTTTYGNTGGTITTDGNYKVHTFNIGDTGTSFFACKAGNVASYLVVGGGGGGSGGTCGGGGGGGGFQTGTDFAITSGSYTITVGDGGAVDTNGGNSVFSSVTAYGGGAGGTYGGPGGDGGCGGGGGGQGGGATYDCHAGVGSQGYNGGASTIDTGSASGGGGAGQAGTNGGDGNNGGKGGNGTASSITGSSVTYGGGGGGGTRAYGSGTTGGDGGTGGGGKGAGLNWNETAGTDNLGGGGGGIGFGVGLGTGKEGGSGTVIIRCLASAFPGGALQSYSESTIKTQGSYSLKGVAAVTTGLRKSLTRKIVTISDGILCNEDMAVITDWTDSDGAGCVSSQETFDGKSCMSLVSATPAASTYARRIQDIGVFGSRTVFSMSIYCDAVGTQANTDYATFVASTDATYFLAAFASDGLFVYDGASYVEVGTDLVVQDTWQEWTFDVNWTAKTVDVYLGGVLKKAGVDCSYDAAGTDGTVEFRQHGTTTAARTTYVDWFKAGNAAGIDLTDQLSTTFDIRASRTGENLTVGLRNNPYPMDSYTKLLIHGAGLDGNAPKAATFVGTAALDTAQYKFGASSLLLDGDSDYLTFLDHADWQLDAGNGSAFTIDGWFRFNSVAANVGFVGQYADDTNNWALVWTTGNKVYFRNYPNSSSASVYISFDFTPVVNTWYHIAFVRVDNSNAATGWRGFVDGISKTLTLEAGAWNGNMSNHAGTFNVGIDLNSTDVFFNGWIDELRISKGIARWTANFILPTVAHIEDQYTALLLHFNGADAAVATYDGSGEDGVAGRIVNFYGTAQFDTAQSKFGGASILFDGNSDLIYTGADSRDWDFAGDFTIDLWARFSAVTTGDYQYILGNADWYNGSDGWGLVLGSSNDSLYFTANWDTNHWDVSAIATSTGIVADTWYHIAVVRYGSTLNIYLNGTAIKEITDSTSIGTTANWMVSGRNANTANYYMGGWISEIRISKGIARWKSNFTPPTRQYSSCSVIESTPDIADADTFQTVETDISAVDDADKNAIDQIQITVIDASA